MKYIRKINGTKQYSIPTPNIVLNESTGKLIINYNCPLYIEALEDLTFKFNTQQDTNVLNISLDGINWQELAPNTDSPTISAGNFCYIKGENLKVSNGSNGAYGPGRLSVTGKFNLGGSINSLKVKRSGEINGAIYSRYGYLFFNNSELIDASNLSLEDNIDEGCYLYMFADCENLIFPPKILPSTTLRKSCYAGMFWRCSSLIQTPILPASVLVNRCYGDMFYDCSSLKSISMLATDISALDCLENWVTGVASDGIFIKNSAATWENTFGTSAIPEGWTVELADA